VTILGLVTGTNDFRATKNALERLSEVRTKIVESDKSVRLYLNNKLRKPNTAPGLCTRIRSIIRTSKKHYQPDTLKRTPKRVKRKTALEKPGSQFDYPTVIESYPIKPEVKYLRNVKIYKLKLNYKTILVGIKKENLRLKDAIPMLSHRLPLNLKIRFRVNPKKKAPYKQRTKTPPYNWRRVNPRFPH
jgi:hypothetical protein